MTAIPAEYDAWIDAATGHLFGALDTARDELERDRDFLTEDGQGDLPSPPQGPARDACAAAAVRRFLAHLNSLQEGS
jgi:hypothetical protein